MSYHETHHDNYYDNTASYEEVGNDLRHTAETVNPNPRFRVPNKKRRQGFGFGNDGYGDDFGGDVLGNVGPEVLIIGCLVILGIGLIAIAGPSLLDVKEAKLDKIRDLKYGTFNSWSAWGACSATCGAGLQTRVRTCSSRLKCPSGNLMESQLCNAPALCPLAFFPCYTVNQAITGNTLADQPPIQITPRDCQLRCQEAIDDGCEAFSFNGAAGGTCTLLSSIVAQPYTPGTTSGRVVCPQQGDNTDATCVNLNEAVTGDNVVVFGTTNSPEDCRLECVEAGTNVCEAWNYNTGTGECQFVTDLNAATTDIDDVISEVLSCT